MDSSIISCPIHGLKYNKNEFKMCYRCYFKKCNVCNKYRLKHDSKYLTCYDCNINQKKEQYKQKKINSIFEYKESN